MVNLKKEEILKCANNIDNELLKLYINNLEDNSSYYILSALCLLKNGNINNINDAIRLKQIKMAIALLENGIEETQKALIGKNKYDAIAYKNDLRIAYEYLLSIYFEKEYVSNRVFSLTENFEIQKLKNNKKALKILDDAYKVNNYFDSLYLIYNYYPTLKKQNLDNVISGIEYLDLNEKCEEEDIFERLVIIAGELITKKMNEKYINKLCDFIIKNDSGNVKAYYFKAAVSKEDDRKMYLDTYIKLCNDLNIEILDPFEIIK